MNAVKTKSYLSQYILIILAALLTLIGFLFSEQEIDFWPAAFAYVKHGEINHPVILGVVPLANLAYFAGFVFLYLHFEFYGFKNAVYSVIALCLGLAALYGCFEGLKVLNYRDPNSLSLINFKSLISFYSLDVISIILSLSSGYITVFFLSSIIRKITVNYFMFIRYFLGGLVGFAVYVVVRLYMINNQNTSVENLVIYGITPYAQFVVGLAGSIVPLYIFRLIFGIFAGPQEKKAKKEKKEKAKKKSESVFRSQSDEDTIDPVQTQKASETTPVQNKPAVEETPSQVSATQNEKQKSIEETQPFIKNDAIAMPASSEQTSSSDTSQNSENTETTEEENSENTKFMPQSQLNESSEKTSTENSKSEQKNENKTETSTEIVTEDKKVFSNHQIDKPDEKKDSNS